MKSKKLLIIRSYIVFSVIMMLDYILSVDMIPGNYFLVGIFVLLIFYSIPNTLFLLLLYYSKIYRKCLADLKYTILESVMYVLILEFLHFLRRTYNIKISDTFIIYGPFLFLFCIFIVLRLLSITYNWFQKKQKVIKK